VTLGQGTSMCGMRLSNTVQVAWGGRREHLGVVPRRKPEENGASDDASSRDPGYGTDGMLEAVATHIREHADAYCESTRVPGYLAGVYHDGDQTIVAYGVANVVTGAPDAPRHRIRFRSGTKVLTTTLVLQQVERGVVDLDERVMKYLPEFRLTTSSAADEIRVRRLLNHANGIDAELFFPVAKGRGALKVFVEGRSPRREPPVSRTPRGGFTRRAGGRRRPTWSRQ